MKTRQQSSVTTRKIISGEHLNPNGTLFGGYLMCWMDEVAFLCARRFTGLPTCVTVNIDNITFRNPLRLGEHILLTAAVNHAGRSSMEIQVNVEREDAVTHELTHTNSAHLTFVCLDERSKPKAVPKLTLESADDRLKNKEALLRIRVRRRLINFLSKRRAVNELTLDHELTAETAMPPRWMLTLFREDRIQNFKNLLLGASTFPTFWAKRNRGSN